MAEDSIEAGAPKPLPAARSVLSVVRKPSVANRRLENLVESLFQATDTLAGGTAGAIIEEIATGQPTLGARRLEGRIR
jgi:hypothetical protein